METASGGGCIIDAKVSAVMTLALESEYLHYRFSKSCWMSNPPLQKDTQTRGTRASYISVYFIKQRRQMSAVLRCHNHKFGSLTIKADFP